MHSYVRGHFGRIRHQLCVARAWFRKHVVPVCPTPAQAHVRIRRRALFYKLFLLYFRAFVDFDYLSLLDEPSFGCMYAGGGADPSALQRCAGTQVHPTCKCACASTFQYISDTVCMAHCVLCRPQVRIMDRHFRFAIPACQKMQVCSTLKGVLYTIGACKSYRLLVGVECVPRPRGAEASALHQKLAPRRQVCLRQWV